MLRTATVVVALKDLLVYEILEAQLGVGPQLAQRLGVLLVALRRVEHVSDAYTVLDLRVLLVHNIVDLLYVLRPTALHARLFKLKKRRTYNCTILAYCRMVLLVPEDSAALDLARPNVLNKEEPDLAIVIA